MDKQILFDNIDRIHTTAMGVNRIKKNLSLKLQPIKKRDSQDGTPEF